MTFPDGATRNFYGVQLANPNAASGKATSTSNEFVVPGAISFGVAGLMNYDYALGANGLSFAPSTALGSTFTAIRVATHLPGNSAEYDARIGNVSVLVNGNMAMSGSGQLTGSVDKLTVTSDKYFSSSVIEGKFNVSTDVATAGMGMTHTAVDGTVTGYRTIYHDGSRFEVTNTATWIGPNDLVEQSVMRASAGNDDVAIELPARLYEDVVFDAGDGNDVLTLAGGGGRLHANGGAGNDVFTLRGDSHRIDGGSGFDTVHLASARAAVTVKAGASPTAFTVTEASGAVQQLVNAERIAFADGMLALDIEGSAGQAYRLYQAAFDRTPDSAGLGYWIAAMDKGASLNSVAASFMTSNEFRDAYGSAPTELELVTRFYENILNRAPDASGLDYWMGVLGRKEATSAEVLGFISESAENKAALIGVIGDGFSYTPYDFG